MFEEDQVLVRSAADGDVSAFTTLYRRHLPRVVGTVFRFLAPWSGDPRNDALCVYHDALPGAITTYDAARGSFASWVTLRAVRRATDMYRAHERAQRLKEEQATQQPPAGSAACSGNTVEDEIIDRQLRGQATELLASCLSDMQDKHRAMLFGFYIDGKAYVELADLHGYATADSARVSLARALTRVRNRHRDELVALQRDFAPVED